MREVLPDHVKPIDYSVKLDVDIEALKFSGVVDISLNVQKPCSSITLNTLDLELGDVYVTTDDEGTDVPVSQMKDANKQTVTFLFMREFEQDSELLLSVHFNGQIKDNYCGLYRSMNVDGQGEKQAVATTFMCPTECRRLFPCFDEPALKAKFKFTVTAKRDLTVLCNTSVESSTEEDADGEKLTTVFKESPSMSTYIVALAIGRLEYAECLDFRVPVRVYSAPGLKDKCQYAADLGARTLKFFESKFGLAYPLDKCDMMALQDSVVSAMENWGLITFRSSAVMFHEATDNAATKRRVSEVVQHELAHQWFGNLVTMEWWDGIWLNEGFATWMSWYALDKFFPEWKLWEEYVQQNLERCLSMDALRTSHRIEVDVARASEINQIFDAISYSKGASVLKMIASYLGEETFLEGVSKYLHKYQYGNTNTIDLWAALSLESDKDVAGIMDKWTKQVGYPLLTVRENGSMVTVTQHRFLANGEQIPEEDLLYPVNLAVKTAAGVVENKQMDERELSFEVHGDYKLNGDQTGIYRVLYPDTRLHQLLQQADWLSNEDLIGLISDYTALAKAGHVSTSSLIQLLKSIASSGESGQMPEDDATTVWSALLASFSELMSTFAFNDRVHGHLKRTLHELVAPVCMRHGWQFTGDEGLLETQLKAMLFKASIDTGDEAATQAAEAMFQRRHDTPVNPNVRLAVFKAASRHDAAAFDELWGIFQRPQSSVEALDALRALGANPANHHRALDLVLAGTIRAQDAVEVVAGVGASCPAGMHTLWQWLTANWTAICGLLPATLNLLAWVVSACTCSSAVIGFSSLHMLQQIDAFFADKDTSGFDRALNNAREHIQARAKWVDRDDVLN